MPRPPLNSIHQPIYQLKDLFQDNSMARITPKNPYNIQWMIENIFLKKYPQFEAELHKISNICQQCIQNNSTFEIKQYFQNKIINNDSDNVSMVCKFLKKETVTTIPKWFQQELILDNNVIARVAQIQKEHNFNIDFLSCKAIRMKSSFLYNALLDLGMNPNEKDATTNMLPIEIALNRKNFKIAKILLLHPKFNLFQKSFYTQKSIPMMAIENQSWKILEFIFEKEPLLFLEKDKNEKTILSYIENLNGGHFLFTKTTHSIKVPERMKDFFTKVFSFMENNNISIPKGKNNDLNKIIIQHNFQSIQNSIIQEKTNLLSPSSSKFKI
jgi:hypothetical protein